MYDYGWLVEVGLPPLIFTYLKNDTDYIEQLTPCKCISQSSELADLDRKCLLHFIIQQ